MDQDKRNATVRILRPSSTQGKSRNSGLSSLPLVQLDANASRGHEAGKLREENKKLSDKINHLEKQILKIKEQHVKECNHVKDSSYQRGKEEGREETKLEIEKKYQDSLQNLQENVRAIIQGWEQEKERIFFELEQPLVDLVAASVEKIIGFFTEQNKDLILPILRKAVKSLGESSSILIKINPEDYQTVNENKQEFLPLEQSGKTVRITTDERITSGSCYLETEFSSLEVNLNQAILNLKDQLVRASNEKKHQVQDDDSWSFTEEPNPRPPKNDQNAIHTSDNETNNETNNETDSEI